MDITSTKRWKLIPVTDLDIMYLGGMHDTITFTDQDKHQETDEFIRVWIVDPKTNLPTESITCLKRNMASFRYRDRTLRLEDTSPLAIDAVVDPPTGD